MNKIVFSISVLYTLLFSVFANATPIDSTKINPLYSFDIAGKSFNSYGYLKAVDTLESLKTVYPNDHPYKNILLQSSLTYNSFIQNNSEYQKLLLEFYKTKEVNLPISYYDSEAIDYIKAQIKDNQVVMINEQHWKPNHRYLGS